MSDRIIETRRFHARIPSGKDAQDFLSDLLSRTAMPLKARNDVRLAVDELFANVASYAYGAGGGYLDMTVHVDETARYASVSMVDEGKAFNPFADDGSTTLDGGIPLGARGLGLLLVRRLVDECLYQRSNGRNETTLIKRWSVAANRNAEALAEAARIIRETEGSEYNAPERSNNPLTDDDLTLVVGGLSMPELPFLRHVGPSSL